jgi:lambda family phage portal protein
MKRKQKKAIRRIVADHQAARVTRQQPSARYEGAYSNRARQDRRGSPVGEITWWERSSLKDKARWLEENDVFVRSLLNTLVLFSVGPKGIGVEPQPIDVRTGEIAHDLAEEMAELRRDWDRAPEVTGRYTWGELEKMATLAMLRDGQVFAHQVRGRIPSLDHLTRVPYSLEMLETDFVPGSAGVDPNSGIVTNNWGRPVFYNVHKVMDNRIGYEIKRIPADEMIHLRNTSRLHQYHGISILAHMMGTLQDIEEAISAELLARKVAACMTAYQYTDGTDEMGAPPAEGYDDPEKMTAGQIYKLAPGTKIGVIDTRRSTAELTAFIHDLKRSACASIMVSHSTVTRIYDGNFSARRQELVDSFMQYGALAQRVISQLSDPVNRSFVATAIASNALRVPEYIRPSSLYEPQYIAVNMPWIDPEKEAKAFAILEERGWISGPEIIRKMGRNPEDVRASEKDWRESLKDMPPHPMSNMGRRESGGAEELSTNDADNEDETEE